MRRPVIPIVPNSNTSFKQWAPHRPTNVGRSWEGSVPWKKFEVEVVIPTIDHPESLPVVIDLLRAQTIKPYIVIIDTGSLPENRAKTEALRADDLEVHCLCSGGWTHSSDPVAVALDLSLSICRTDYQILTHNDCFLMRVNAIEELVSKISKDIPVVGYQITPRPWIVDWECMVGHTWTGLHVPSIRNINARWSYGAHLANRGDKALTSFDTEYNFCRELKKGNIFPMFLGIEENWTRNQNEDFDHCRSLTCGELYGPEHKKIVTVWIKDAIEQAKIRLEKWTSTPS